MKISKAKRKSFEPFLRTAANDIREKRVGEKFGAGQLSVARVIFNRFPRVGGEGMTAS
jgi:hypothetical protein